MKYLYFLIGLIIFISGCSTLPGQPTETLIFRQIVDVNTIDNNVNEFIELNDTPGVYVDTNRLLAVNEAGDGLYFPLDLLIQNIFDVTTFTTDDITEGVLTANQFSQWTDSGALLLPTNGEGWLVFEDSFMTGVSTLSFGSGFGPAHILFNFQDETNIWAFNLAHTYIRQLSI